MTSSKQITFYYLCPRADILGDAEARSVQLQMLYSLAASLFSNQLEPILHA